MKGIPEVVRNKAIAYGAPAWLDELPSLVADLEREWSLVVGRIYSDSTEAFVADATLADGTAAVLKLMVPRPDQMVNEMTVLRLTGGEGCVRLLRHDAGRDAMLLERLGPSLHDLGVPVARRHEILCDVASKVWRRVPAGCALPTGAEKGRWLIEAITRTWEELDRPCSARAVDHAVACAERRIAAHDDERAVLVHGDVHQWNTLQTLDGGGFKLVDPDGLLTDPEYDLGIVMREDPDDGDLRERARWLAARTGLDVVAIWEWGVVERVSTGLLCVEIDLQPIGRQMLAAAEAVAFVSP